MQIEIKKIKKIILLSSFLMFFSLAFYVFASFNEAENKNYLLDSDQDGLTDEEEKAYGTNPYVADTDGDGYSDGVEVKTGYDPLKKAPGDKIVVEKKAEIASVDAGNLTSKLSSDLKPLLSSIDNGENKQVSINDLDSVLQGSLTTSSDIVISQDSLPKYDVPGEKIIKQDYSGISDNEKKIKIKEDTIKYLSDVAYIFANNMPEKITNNLEMKDFVKSLASHVNDLTKSPPDYSYYASIGKKIEAIVEELELIKVPENMLEIHKNGVSILKEYLRLGEIAPNSSSDPISQTMFIKQLLPLVEISANYLRSSYISVNSYLNVNK